MLTIKVTDILAMLDCHQVKGSMRDAQGDDY